MLQVPIKRYAGSPAIKDMAWFDSCVSTGVLKFVERVEDRNHYLEMQYHNVRLCTVAHGTILGPDHTNYAPCHVGQKQATQIILSSKVVDVIRYIAWTWCSSYCSYEHTTTDKTPSDIVQSVEVTWT